MTGAKRFGGDANEEIDHYDVLGLPSGEEGAKLTQKEIKKAYRKLALELHPDKCPDDPNAAAAFQRLTASFEALGDDTKRSLLDARLRARREKIARDGFLDSKRRKLATDLERREKAAAEEDEERRATSVRRTTKNAAAALKKELADFRARNANKAASTSISASGDWGGEESGRGSLDKGRMLKVSWERELGGYGAGRLREIFERFGSVEDVVIRSKGSKKRASAIVVMSTKDATVAATHGMSGDLSNPLLVLPVQSDASNITGTSPAYCSETITPKLNNIVGAGFQDFEASILKKLEKPSLLLRVLSASFPHPSLHQQVADVKNEIVRQ